MTPIRSPEVAVAQKNLFDDHPPGLADPSPDMIRQRLQALLATAQGAARMPWDAQRARVNAHLFHNMANWLPEPERDALREAFTQELERLRAASG